MQTRRAFLAGSVFGLGLADALAWARGPATAKSCVLVWLDGGPSHLETFDLKPEAPAEIRGAFRPAKTPLDGVRICEHLPRTAALLDRTTLIRSLTSPEGNHDRASHYLLTGRRPSPALVYPSMGSVVAQQAPPSLLPAYLSVPTAPAYGGEGFLPVIFAPFSGTPPPPLVPAARVERRRSMLATLDRLADLEVPGYAEQAFALTTSKEARAAFDLSKETPAAQARYGMSKLGQGCLLARRLVEAGARFVTVNDEGWDTHDDQFRRLAGTFHQGKMIYRGKLPDLDLGLSALLEDLEQRGLLESTLVVVMGEFGRTPKLNSKGGRDHWPRASSVLLAGGGVKRGAVVGATDAHGELPAERPVLPEDLLATIYRLLGIDPAIELQAPGGRPIRILDGGAVVTEALA